VDALSLFVTNMKGFFANLNECSICYGVLAVDRTTPTKECPNGHWFHGICLFKVICSKIFTNRVVVQDIAWLNLPNVYVPRIDIANCDRQGYLQCIII